MTYIYHLIFWTVLGLLALYASKKYNNARNYIWFTYISIVGVLINIWNYFTQYILELSLQSKVINSKILLGIAILNGLLILFATYKVLKKKSDKEEYEDESKK
jgi:hypothetical protein